jgi:hypothetical protein
MGDFGWCASAEPGFPEAPGTRANLEIQRGLFWPQSHPLAGLSTGAASNPIEQQKRAREKWKYAIERVCHRVGMPINRAKDSEAKQRRQQAY